MNPSDLSTVKSILLEALQQPESGREAFVRLNSQLSLAQRDQVLELLRAQSKIPDVLTQPFSALLPSRNPLSDAPVLERGSLVADRYRVELMLATSYSSQVYVASDLRLAGKRVALKLIPISSDRFSEYQDQLWREIEALSRLHHPSISGIIDTGIHHEHPYLVTQFYEGPTLDQWLIENVPTADARLRLFLHLLSIVEVIHRAGLMHLDLKPQNIIVNSEPGLQPSVTILDFGIASLAGEQVQHTAGTPDFSAPERASRIALQSSDVYSLARIAEMMLLAPPRAVERIIKRALSLDPTQRPQNATEFRRLLEEAHNIATRNRLILTRVIPIAAVFAAVFWVLISRQANTGATAPVVKEVTSLRGAETEPVFSADGKTLYFTHDNYARPSNSIYSLPIEGGEPHLLFNSERNSRISVPVASHDGQYIAFLEELADGTKLIKLGNLSTSAAEVLYTGDCQHLAFHPNSRILYFVERTKEHPRGLVRRLDLDTNKVETFPAPPLESNDVEISVSPNGRYLVATRFRTLETGDHYLFLLDPSGQPLGPAKRITFLDKRVQRSSWRPDSSGFLFTAGSLTSFHAYEAILASDPTSPASVKPLPGWAAQMRYPTVSPDGKRVAFVRDREDCEIYRLHLDGARHLDPFISSSQLDEEPRYSPDGKSVAFFSERSGSLQGWISDLGAFPKSRQLTRLTNGEKAWPAWAPDNSLLYFVRIPALGPQLLRASLDGNPVLTSLLSAPGNQRIAGISADARAVFYEYTDKPHRITRVSLDGSQVEPVAEIPARFIREFYKSGTSGPRLILFSEQNDRNGLFMLEDGKVRKLYPDVYTRNTFTYRDGFAYLVSRFPQLGIYKIEVATGRASLILELDKSPGWGMDVSPDSKELLVPLFDVNDSSVVVAEWPTNSN